MAELPGKTGQITEGKGSKGDKKGGRGAGRRGERLVAGTEGEGRKKFDHRERKKKGGWPELEKKTIFRTVKRIGAASRQTKGGNLLRLEALSAVLAGGRKGISKSHEKEQETLTVYGKGAGTGVTIAQNALKRRTVSLKMC